MTRRLLAVAISLGAVVWARSVPASGQLTSSGIVTSARVIPAWYATARTAPATPVQLSRVLAMVHAVMHDAVNGGPRYETYASDLIDVRAHPEAWLLVFFACASQSTANKAERSVAPGANDRYATEEGRAAALQMLEGESRDEYQKPDQIIENMKLKEGDVVCEVGSGSGYFTPFLSKAVGNTGQVYAEDPQPEFLDVLGQKKEKHGLRNVEIVQTDRRTSERLSSRKTAEPSYLFTPRTKWAQPCEHGIGSAVT